MKNIIKESASGSVRAQEKLYRMFAPKMFGVCLRYAKDRTEAEDNLQDGFLKVFLNIGSFRHEGSFEGWIRRIMVNISLSKYRRQHILYPSEDMTKYESVQVSDDVMAEIGAEELLGLIQKLSPQYRLVFNLFVMEGMSHQEVSEKLGISVGTSKSNLARARNILKRKVWDLYGEVELNTNYPA